MSLLRTQIESMRANAAAIVANCDALLEHLGPDEMPGVCRHPKEARLDTTTMGEPPSYRCTVCGQDVTGTPTEEHSHEHLSQ